MSDRIIADPRRDPIGFIKAPLGRSARQVIRDHLSEIVSHMTAITLICERYPGLLSDEDLDFLNGVWLKVDSIEVRKKR